MKTFKLTLADGASLTFRAKRMTRDGGGVHLFDDNDELVAAFMYTDVKSAYAVEE